MNMINTRIGRNERCPCGSGRKYKHCCGSYAKPGPLSLDKQEERRLTFQRTIAEHEAKEARRRQQQGLGRPIISTELGGHRIVAVGNTVHWSRRWNTFHDFLFDYLKEIFSHDWGAIHRVFESMRKHHDIPSTFSGEMPETYFQRPTERLAPLKVGSCYLVPDEKGNEVLAELENATVIESESKAYGVCRRLDNNFRVIIIFPLSEQEVAAYRKYPETFFGTVDSNAGRKCENIFDWYDFFFESYGRTPKEKLLEFMKDARDIEALKTLSQEDLAVTYCERLAYGVEHRRKDQA